MRVRDIIRAEKQVTDAGAWKRGTKMPKSAFPLTKQGSFKVGPAYSWRVVRFQCLGGKFRVLILYRLELNKYCAYLAEECGQDMKVLARYDYHADEPGWHLHAVCESGTQVAGRTGGMSRRLPDGGKRHRRTEFGITDEDVAFAKVVDMFRLSPPFELAIQ
jgi:hypothetical protein